MAPTIRIDDDVYKWLKSQAIPFDDTPNSVLRRVSGLDKGEEGIPLKGPSNRQFNLKKDKNSSRKSPLAQGKELINRWDLPVQQARFHRDGHYYEHLTKFPAALCDRSGYVIFENEEEYKKDNKLQLGQQVNVDKPGISAMPKYQEAKDVIS